MASKTVQLVSRLCGSVQAEYFPHKRLVFSAYGFLIKVCKPYGREVRKQTGYNVLPLIEMSTNHTVVTDTQRLGAIQDLIAVAIQFLNSENDGIVIPYGFSCTGSAGEVPCVYKVPDVIKTVHDKNKPVQKKGIPYKNIRHDVIYSDSKGKKWVYVGRGSFYRVERNGDRHLQNKEGAHHVYIDFDKMLHFGYKVIAGGTIVVGESCSMCVDSFATKKKLVEVAGQIHWDGESLQTVRADGFIEKFVFSNEVNLSGR